LKKKSRVAWYRHPKLTRGRGRISKDPKVDMSRKMGTEPSTLGYCSAYEHALNFCGAHMGKEKLFLENNDHIKSSNEINRVEGRGGSKRGIRLERKSLDAKAILSKGKKESGGPKRGCRIEGQCRSSRKLEKQPPRTEGRTEEEKVSVKNEKLGISIRRGARSSKWHGKRSPKNDSRALERIVGNVCRGVILLLKTKNLLSEFEGRT